MLDGHRAGTTRLAPSLRHGPRSRSLYHQLVLIPTIMMIAGVATISGVVLLQAKARIAAEIRSGMELGRDLAAIATREVSTLETSALVFDQLARSLPRVRHVEFEFIPSDDSTKLRIAGAQPLPQNWVGRVLSPLPEDQRFPVIVNGRTVGELRLRPNPADEIAEITSEVELFSGALILLCLLIVGTLLWAVRRSLRPVELLADGFDRLERGDYRPIPPIPNRELRRVGEQFNHLAQSLCRVTADNHLLVHKLLSVQEEERRQIATELHDESGPALFGIRAEATCILRLAPGEEQPGLIRAHARAIADLTEGIQRLNSRMLSRLRPLVLEHMGLRHAIRELVTSWQARYPQIKWSLEIQGHSCEPREELGLVLYRVVQEAVTNAIRHAHASKIEICLNGRTPDEGRDRCPGANATLGICLTIQDDGIGLPDDLRYGFGLLGMTERVRQLGGTLKIGNTRVGGTVVQAWIPAEVDMVRGECVHADPAA
ncbi:MAG: HAMP domain-containing protein [Acetobacteraceae bacterium]|nr:HAMP domain-containing protein [Acetobacteraceae bacterium]